MNIYLFILFSFVLHHIVIEQSAWALQSPQNAVNHLACSAVKGSDGLPPLAASRSNCGKKCDQVISKDGRAVNTKLRRSYGKSSFINVREVLPGLFYRFGANRARGRDPKLSQAADARHLCKLGFTHVFRANGKANSTFTCPDGSKIKYLSVSVTSSPKAAERSFKRNVLPVLHDCLEQKMRPESKGRKCRIATHCTDGMHRAGAVAAMVKREICGTSGAEAFDYWSKRQIGWGGNYSSHRRKYRARIGQYKSQGLPSELVHMQSDIRKILCSKKSAARAMCSGSLEEQNLPSSNEVRNAEAVTTNHVPQNRLDRLFSFGAQ